ncbi:MAG: TRAP transporter large permease subunit, partial [Planctomycetes bacterium]|nr:TRAP transporter large permease subunit [Planctomycetota bacterium]
ALGIIMVINTSIGMITPPMAVNLFVASGISGVSIPRITQRILPYFFLLIGLILLFTFVPGIITLFA